MATSMTNGHTNDRSLFATVQQGHDPRYDFHYIQSQLHPELLKSFNEQPPVEQLKLPPKCSLK